MVIGNYMSFDRVPILYQLVVVLGDVICQCAERGPAEKLPTCCATQSYVFTRPCLQYIHIIWVSPMYCTWARAMAVPNNIEFVGGKVRCRRLYKIHRSISPPLVYIQYVHTLGTITSIRMYCTVPFYVREA